MRACIAAQCISRSVRQRLDAAPFAGRVLAVFEHACDLVSDDGDVVALVLPRIGAGPLNIVVGASPAAFRQLDAGLPVSLENERLHVGPWSVSLEGAVVWEPRPNWEWLRARASSCRDQLGVVRTAAQRLAPPGSLLPLVVEATTGKQDSAEAAALRARSTSQGTCRSFGAAHALEAAYSAAVSALRADWRGDADRLRAGVAQLAGLGGGLTPAGDDWLCGAMLGAWLTHPQPGWLCAQVVETALGRTSALSAAFLRAAGRGECAPAWHRLLAALCADAPAETEVAARDVLFVGETSGADALAGFLWAVLT